MLDFGLAKVVIAVTGPDGSAGALPTITVDGTDQGTILGTVAYMSPEQARGKDVDERTDIWAFGCVLFEMISGTPPYAGDTMSDTLAAFSNASPIGDGCRQIAPRRFCA